MQPYFSLFIFTHNQQKVYLLMQTILNLFMELAHIAPHQLHLAETPDPHSGKVEFALLESNLKALQQFLVPPRSLHAAHERTVAMIDG